MKAIVEFNNDAAHDIGTGKYKRAISSLNKALLVCHQHSSSSTQQLQHDEKIREDELPLEYDEGMDLFLEPFIISPSKAHCQRFVKVVIFYNLGIAHLRCRNNEDALAYFEKVFSENMTLQSFNFSSAALSLDKNEIIALYHNLGYAYFLCERSTESLLFYNKALKLVLEMYGYYHIHVSCTLNCLGVIHLHSMTDKDNTSEVLGLFTEALAINQAILDEGQAHALNATIMNNIGRIRFVRKEYDLAKAMYEESYSTRLRLYGDDHIDVAAVHYNLGEVNHLLGNLDKAIYFYREFLTIVLIKLNQKHFDAVLALKKLGQIYHNRNDCDRAIEVYVKALEIVKESLGEYHIETASLLNKIGNICYERQEFLIAMRVYEDGLKIEQKIFDAYHPNIVITMINIARIHHQEGRLEVALQIHQEVLIMQRNNCSSRSDRLNLACTLSSMGLINDQRKQYSLAIDEFEEALDIRVKELGENHFDVSSTLNAIGLIHFKQGLYDLAIHTFKQSLNIRLNLENGDTADIAVVLFNIAAIYLEKGESEKAIKYYQQTLHYEYNALNKEKTDVISTLQRLAQIYEHRGDLNQALEYYQEAVDYYTTNPTDQQQNSQIARVYSCIGSLYIQTGDNDRAMEAYTQALRINRLAGITDNHNLVVDGIELYGLIKEQGECAPAA